LDGVTATFSQLCLDPSAGGGIYLYRGSNTPPTRAQCGSEASGWERTLIVGGQAASIDAWSISRATAPANVVRLDCTLTSSSHLFSGSAELTSEVMIENAQD
jgi:hypothetical protein